MPTSPLPLEGVLVLDLSRVLAGPFATMMMADMGATIIKIEEPYKGDDTRGFGPPFIEGESTYFMSFNRNKRSVAVDLKHPEGLALVRRLALSADIVVENFRPGVAERMGLGYAALSAEKPALIYVSVSGFGQTGPERLRPGYDLLAQGMGGFMSLTGPEDGEPYKVGVSQADLVAGMYAMQGALLALLSRQRTGKGQHVDVCLLDGQISLLSFIATATLNSGRAPRRHGNRHASIAPYQTYAAADGWFNVAAGNDRMFGALAQALGRPELADDPRFATNADRVANLEALNEIITPIWKTKPAADWIAALDAADVPAGPILPVDEVLAHPQVQAREMVTEVAHPTAGAVRLVGSPVKLSETPARIELAPPLLGQHTAEVLRVMLDMTDEAVADLAARGVIRPLESETEDEADAAREDGEQTPGIPAAVADETNAKPAQEEASA